MAAVLAVQLMLCSCASGEAQESLPPAAAASAPPVATLVSGVEYKPQFNQLTGEPLAENQNYKRPLAVMIDNVKTALPQAGIADADIIYEMVTEGGITRLMAVFSDYEAMQKTGPVRSARDQHVKLMLGLNSFFLHIGSSTYADDLLEIYKYDTSSVNGLYQVGALMLDTDRAKKTDIEHCWFTDNEHFINAVSRFKLDTEQKPLYSAFKFAQEKRELQGEEARSLRIRFSSYVTAAFDYNETDGKYYKSQYNQPHIDSNTGQQISFDNVIVLFTDITKYPDKVLAKVRYEYGGVGFYINGGRCEPVRWAKNENNSPLLILSNDGTERYVEINTGKTYVAITDLSLYSHFQIDDTSAQDLALN